MKQYLKYMKKIKIIEHIINDKYISQNSIVEQLNVNVRSVKRNFKVLIIKQVINMSKQGIEEKETLDAINEIGLSSNVLDIAAGDGRFINKLLKLAQSVTAIDIDKKELDFLKNNCPKEYSNKLNIEIVDITKPFPYENNLFDGIFCTGTLHLFNKDTIGFIIKEIERCLKKNDIKNQDTQSGMKASEYGKFKGLRKLNNVVKSSLLYSFDKYKFFEYNNHY